MREKYKKILSDGTVITYVYDNEKLISEKHSDRKELIYLYDLDGVYGFIVCNYGNRNYSKDFYYFEKDAIVDNSFSIYSLYAYNIGVNNPVEVVYNDHTMYSGHDLTYEEPEKSKWRMFCDSF